jgi:NAD(P)-dependent dehydrogenase (short-subunit alcohol dehydrogenase family)
MSLRKRFMDKVVLITGGSAGIGFACAKAFAAEGASVVLTGRNPRALDLAATSLGPSVLALRSDVSDTASHAELTQHLRHSHGQVDVVFANAGTSVRKSISQVSEPDWDLMMSVNLKGHYFMIQSLLPLMPRGANIVLASSVAVSRPRTGHSVYAASKSGLASLVVSLGCELVSRGIRVNAVSPGPIDTPRAAGRPVSPAALQVFRDSVAAANPMKRWGTAAEVANAVLFLASDEASYITGANLAVDGGAGCF